MEAPVMAFSALLEHLRKSATGFAGQESVGYICYTITQMWNIKKRVLNCL